MVAEEAARQLARLGPASSSSAGGHGSHSVEAFVPGTVMLRGWARYGDPESQASASEVEELWRAVSAKFCPATMADLVPARAAVSNHTLLLRVRNAPLDSRLALQHARDLRDSLDVAVADMQFRGLPLRVSIEHSPQSG